MAPSTSTGEPPRAARAAERGYTLAVVVGVLTVMAIALGAALPHWAKVAQRDREAELIARGFQYAEAIRVFQKRFGRLPNRLEELVEVEPRSIRQLWDDPMPEGGWLVLIEGPGGTIVPIDPETGEIVAGAGADEEGDGADEKGDGDGEEDGEAEPEPPRRRRPATSRPGGEGTGVAGPIHGVKSRAKQEAYRVLFDRKDVGDWEFTVERLTAAISATAPDGLPRRADYATLGKPFRYPPPGGIPGATEGPAGGRPRRADDPPPEGEE